MINVPEISSLLHLLNSPFSSAKWLIDQNGSGYIQVDFYAESKVWFSLTIERIKRDNLNLCQFLALGIESLFYRVIQQHDEELLESYLSGSESAEDDGLPSWFRDSLEQEIIIRYAEQIQQQGLVLKLIDK
ncbi:MAG: hypothetical protein ACFFDW_11930 [Candidatus Thorarchaeota archaeon]